MTGPQIEIQEANPPGSRLLGALDLHGGFDRKRGVADPAGVGTKATIAGRTCSSWPGRTPTTDTRNNVDNFLRSGLDDTQSAPPPWTSLL